MDTRHLHQMLDKKRAPYQRMLEDQDKRDARRLKIIDEQTYQNDRVKWWTQRAEALEQEAQKAREKAQKAAERRDEHTRVLGDIDWTRNAAERQSRLEQIQSMERILAKIEEYNEVTPKDQIEKDIIEEIQLKLEKEFKSVKGRGV